MKKTQLARTSFSDAEWLLPNDKLEIRHSGPTYTNYNDSLDHIKRIMRQRNPNPSNLRVPKIFGLIEFDSWWLHMTRVQKVPHRRLEKFVDFSTNGNIQIFHLPSSTIGKSGHSMTWRCFLHIFKVYHPIFNSPGTPKKKVILLSTIGFSRWWSRVETTTSRIQLLIETLYIYIGSYDATSHCSRAIHVHVSIDHMWFKWGTWTFMDMLFIWVFRSSKPILPGDNGGA